MLPFVGPMGSLSMIIMDNKSRKKYFCRKNSDTTCVSDETKIIHNLK